MDNGLNIPFEFFFMGLQFVSLWLLFYGLYYQDSKVKRTLLVTFMVLWCFLHNIIIGPLFSLPIMIKLITQIGAYAILVFFTGGKKRNVYIMAVFFWGVSLLVDHILACLAIGFTASPRFSNDALYYLGTGVEHILMFLWALFYYSVMRTTPQEALDRIPLRFWIIVLLAPFIGGAAVIYISGYPFKIQLAAGYNNYFFLSVFGIILLIFDIFIFYLFIKLVTEFNSYLFAGELNKTPPVYTPKNGLSVEFIEKYDLTKRQVEIAEALLQGKSNKEIAVCMNLEVNTVKVHLQAVYRKIGAPGRYALMTLVGRSGETSS
ncbi:MAG: helix-turn-helix transcriptional regulator [Treponema sp.]|jgi:DNA-binding CsgD family transcriptional regulator|nr:helix-turn-helix transcriptional regulator [Treponema sp.]